MKLMLRLLLLPALFTALAAGSCENAQGKVDVRTLLPLIPAQYRSCAARELTKFPSGKVTRAQLVTLLADVRKDSVTYKGCLQGLVAWYDQVRKSYAKK